MAPKVGASPGKDQRAAGARERLSVCVTLVNEVRKETGDSGLHHWGCFFCPIFHIVRFVSFRAFLHTRLERARLAKKETVRSILNV